MSRLEVLLDEYKQECCKTMGCNESGLVSDSELLVSGQDWFAKKLGGHALFWQEIIRWADKRFSRIDKLPMSCIVEKGALIQGLGGYDSSKLNEKDYETLLIKLHQTLNKPSRDAYTLVNNRAKGIEANSKRSLQINIKIRRRAEELANLIKLKKSIIRTLMEEFNLSEATIRRAIKNK